MTLVGIVGGGQLGMMLAEAATELGIGCITLDPASDSPASRVAPAIVGAYDDETALADLAAAADVVTYEFENVPVASARFLAERVLVLPPPESLEFAQDRLLEKTLFEEVSLAVAPYSAVASREDLAEALDVIGVPSVLKTRRLGYDGKGQVRMASVDEADSAWEGVEGLPRSSSRSCPSNGSCPSSVSVPGTERPPSIPSLRTPTERGSSAYRSRRRPTSLESFRRRRSARHWR